MIQCNLKIIPPQKILMILKVVQNFIKIKFGAMKSEDANELQSIFKTNLNEISKEDLNQKSKKVH